MMGSFRWDLKVSRYIWYIVKKKSLIAQPYQHVPFCGLIGCKTGNEKAWTDSKIQYEIKVLISDTLDISL